MIARLVSSNRTMVPHLYLGRKTHFSGRDICTAMFIVELFTIAKVVNNLTGASFAVIGLLQTNLCGQGNVSH